MQRIHFFATAQDLISTFGTLDVKFVRMGMFDDKNTDLYKALIDIPDLAIVSVPSASLSQTFLIMPTGHKPKFERVFQVKGGKKYCVDQSKNKNSIMLMPGGICDENIIMAGNIATISETSISKNLFKTLSSLLKNDFIKYRDYYLGQEALEKFETGCRMVTMGVDQPIEYDLS